MWIFPHYKLGEGGINEQLLSIYLKPVMFLDKFVWVQIIDIN